MTDAPAKEDLIAAIADTLERLQIEPANLFTYVEGLRARYMDCAETLRNVAIVSKDEVARLAARNVLERCGLDVLEEDVSHETN